MAGPLSTERVIKAVLKGIAAAQKDYESWSGEWLWEAPEYLATVYVAREIAKLKDAKWITLESSTKGTISDAGAKGRGRLHHKVRGNGRLDILLWWGNATPRAPIEVKVQVAAYDKIKADVERIEKMVHLNKGKSTLGFGCVGFYSSFKGSKSITAKQKIEATLRNILDNAKAQVGDKCLVAIESSRIVEDGDSAWVAAALAIRPRGQSVLGVLNATMQDDGLEHEGEL